MSTLVHNSVPSQPTDRHPAKSHAGDVLPTWRDAIALGLLLAYCRAAPILFSDVRMLVL